MSRNIIHEIHISPDNFATLLNEGLLKDSIHFQYGFYKQFLASCEDFKYFHGSQLQKIIVRTSISRHKIDDDKTICNLCLSSSVGLVITGNSYTFDFDTNVLYKMHQNYNNSAPHLHKMYKTYDSIIQKLDYLFYTNDKSIVQRNTSIELIDSIKASAL